MAGVTSYLLTETSKVTFQIGSDKSTTVTLATKTAAFAPPLATTYKGTVTWELTTDDHNTINGSKVALSLDNITTSITTTSFPIADEGSGSISGSKISNVTVSNEIPLCEKDGSILSISGDCHVVNPDTGAVTYLSGNTAPSEAKPNPGNGYTCKCEFDSVQTVVSGLTS